MSRLMRRVAGLVLLSAAIIGAGFGVSRLVRGAIEATAETSTEIPTSRVRRGDITITVSAKGDLQGGVSAPMTVPAAGAAELPITFLRSTGELVEAGDIVAEFDASTQEYNLQEAEADLEEAAQALAQAEAEARLKLEDARMTVFNAELDLRIAELAQLENEFVGAIEQRQNEISFERAKNKHEQAVLDLENAEATADAGLSSKQAAVGEAMEKAETARRLMTDLTLRAPRAGYVQLAENTTSISYLFAGMVLPTFQAGDMARPGQTIALIPDMSHFEVSSQIPETDRAFLEVGQEVFVEPRAMPGRRFRGHISLIGGATGSSWSRSFNCRVALDEIDPDLRPGMSVDIFVNVETLRDVLWVPSQALFGRDGNWFLYERTDEGYLEREVALVRRTESQAVLDGIEEGVEIALARPDQPSRPAPSGDSPLGALP